MDLRSSSLLSLDYFAECLPFVGCPLIVWGHEDAGENGHGLHENGRALTEALLGVPEIGSAVAAVVGRVDLVVAAAVELPVEPPVGLLLAGLSSAQQSSGLP